MSSPFKFLRRVRIHGGECDAVARALHHKAKSFSLPAVKENVSFATNERKSMSTKTTFKRLALVVVSALGFGLLGNVPAANAADTASFSVSASSVTVITPASSYDSSNANGAIFKITLRNVGTTATSQVLQSGETLTASVLAVPAGTAATAKTVADNAADLVLHKVTPATDTAVGGNPYSVETRAAFTNTATASNATWGAADTTAYLETLGSTGLLTSYYLRVTPGAGKTVIDQGEYQIRLRLTSNNSSFLVEDEIIKVRFVSTPIGAGFTLSATAVGTFAKGNAAISTYSSTKYLRAVLADANGGRVVSETTAGTVAKPNLTADFINATSTVIGAATANDDGSSADFGTPSTANANTSHQLEGNNTYGITFAANQLDTATVGSTDSLRVRFGDKTATAALTILSEAGGTATTPTVSATGMPVTDVSPNWSLPLTTTSATVIYPGATPGNGYVGTVTWTGTASGSVTPASATQTTYYADANGRVNIPLTNSAPIDGATATVTISGFATSTAAVAQVLTWRASTAYSVSVDINGSYVKTKTANTAVATVVDHFGAPVVGALLVPSFSTGSEYYSATRTYAALTSNASGQVSYSWTDATAAADDYDAITFTVVGTSVAGTGTITYAAADPAPTALSVFYNANPDATQSFASVATAAPATGIYATGTTPFAVKIARNNSKPIDPASSEDSLLMRVDGNVEGAKIVATGTAGVWFFGAASLVKTTLTAYADEYGDAYFVVGSTKSGANTVTFTSGAVTKTAAFWSASTLGNTRFVTLTGPATGAANGDLLAYNVTVTDRYGNPMTGATVSITASGAAVLGGGNTIASYTTDSTGTFGFTGTSLNTAGGTGSFKASVTTGATANDTESSAGLVGATTVDSTVAAGNASATVSVTFAAGTSATQAAAEAATDAAAEAIDAANAATDAANLAAEAADAATVAAEEARDAADAATAAVEELATQVATLMAALKAQITTLANTVAKIAKKVKA
jgi:hypothetical protein